MNIIVPPHVQNETAYIAAAKARIRANAAKSARKEFFATHTDAERISDWLNETGEFGPSFVTRNPEDQSEFDQMSDACEPNELYEIADRFDAYYKPHEMVVGMFTGDFGAFLMELRDNLTEYGKLTTKQLNVVRKALARKEAWVAEAKKKRDAATARDKGSEFVGELKERREWTLTIRKVMTFDGEWGITYINLMNDDQGNVIVGKGTKRFGEEGSTVNVVATIVRHNTRDGVKQTFINRPKFK